MFKSVFSIVLAGAILLAFIAPAPVTDSVIDILQGSKKVFNFSAALKSAGLVEQLQGDGPYTILAPLNTAFNKLPAGSFENLFKPENKATLTTLLNYHILPIKLTKADLAAGIEKGKGKMTLKTIQGGTLTATLIDGKLQLTDANGATAYITLADKLATNGVVHFMDGVLMVGK
jgi:uncharacterized surface protein with fasciclin (FAS1) repeats